MPLICCLKAVTLYSKCTHIDSKATRYNCSQSILFYCKISLHVSGVFHTHHQEYRKLQVQNPVQDIWTVQLPSSNVAKATLEEGSCTVHLSCTGGCIAVLCTPDDGCGRHPKHVEWSCSIINWLRTAASCWFTFNTDLWCTESLT